MKFRKKPVVIEAVQFFYAQQPWPDGMREPPCPCNIDADNMYIETLEGHHHVSDGDWIITGVKGEKYPCKPDVFAATYEAVEEK